MIVYHGGTAIIENPDVKFSKKYLDFGRGFYVTTYKEQAEKWAKRRSMRNREKAVVNMAIMEDGKEVPYTYNYAMVKEDDGWAVSPDGVIECTNVEAPEIVSGKLNIYLSKMIKLVDGYILRADISNNSSKAYSFGKEGNLCKVVVETTEGEYSTSMLEEVKLDKKVKTYFMARFDELEGEVKKVTVTNIYDIEDDAIKEDSIRDIIIYEK